MSVNDEFADDFTNRPWQAFETTSMGELEANCLHDNEAISSEAGEPLAVTCPDCGRRTVLPS